jgi:hypothetical protein
MFLSIATRCKLSCELSARLGTAATTGVDVGEDDDEEEEEEEVVVVGVPGLALHHARTARNFWTPGQGSLPNLV